MLAEIGFMVGLYIIVRMLSFVTRKGDREEVVGVKIAACVTIAFTALIIYDLLSRGLGGGSEIPGM